jgi:hypothetical protein
MFRRFFTVSLKLSVIERTFHFAELKINRADQHVSEVEHSIAEFVKRDGCRARLDVKPDGTGAVALTSDPIPAEIPLAIGDAFHNLNCALDYIAWGLLDSVGKASNTTHFPCNESRHKLRESFKRPRPHPTDPSRTLPAGSNRKIAVEFPRVAMAILCKIKPHPNGRMWVREIRDADTADKHRLITPAIYEMNIRNVRIVDAEGNNRITIGSITVPAHGTHFPIGLGGAAGLEMHYDDKPLLQVSFPDSGVIFAGEPVVPTLRQCVQLTREVVGILKGEVIRH